MMNNFDPKTAKPYTPRQADEVEEENSQKGRQQQFDRSTAKPYKAPNKGATGFIKDLGLSAAQGAVKTPGTLLAVADAPLTGGKAGKWLEDQGLNYGDQVSQELDKHHTERSKQQQFEYQQAGERADTNTGRVLNKFGYALSNPSMIGDTVAQSLPDMLVGGKIGGKLSNKGKRFSAEKGAAVGEGTMMAGHALEDIRQDTDDRLLTGEQIGYGVATGAAGALFAWGGNRLAKKLGLVDVDTLITKGLSPQEIAQNIASMPAKSVPKSIIQGAVSEGFLEELPQETSETILGNLATGKEWNEGIDDAIVMAPLAGMAMGGTVSGAGAFNSNKNRKRAQNAQTPEDPTEEQEDIDPQPNTPPQFDGGVPPQAMQDEYKTETLGRGFKRSEQLGLNPNQGSLSAAAALSVDNGASPIGLNSIPHEGEYLGQANEVAPSSRGFNQKRKSTYGLDPYGNVTDVDGRSVPVEPSDAPRLPFNERKGRAPVYEVDPEGRAMPTSGEAAESRKMRINTSGLKGRGRAKQNEQARPEQAYNPAEYAESTWAGMNTYQRAKAAKDALGLEGNDLNQVAVSNWESLSDDHKSKMVEAMDSNQGGTWTDPNARNQDDSAPVLQNRDRSNDKSLEQMRDIASNPDYFRLGTSRDFGNGSPVIEEVTNLQPEQVGRADFAATAEGRRIPVQYAAVEADQLLSSNDINGNTVPKYANGVEGMGRAIAGNGRITGLKEAWKKGTATSYLDEMLDDSTHGIDPEVIADMNSPVLVRMMPKSEVTQNIGDESNTGGQLGLTKLEQAKTDARRVNWREVSFNEAGNIDIDTIATFVHSMPASENLVSNGKFSQEAYDRLEAAMMEKAFGNDELTQMQAERDSESKSIIGALVQSAPTLIDLEGAGIYDIRPLIAEAASVAISARRRGVRLSEQVKQVDMGVSPEVYPILEMMLNDKGAIRSKEYIATQFKNIAELALKEAQSSGVDMFGEVPKRTQEETIKDAMTEVEGDGQLNTSSTEGMGQQSGAEPNAEMDEQTGGEQPRPQDGTRTTTEGSRPETEETTQGIAGNEAWRNNYIRAAKKARELGIDPKQHKKLDDLVKAIDANDSNTQSEQEKTTFQGLELSIENKGSKYDQGTMADGYDQKETIKIIVGKNKASDNVYHIHRMREDDTADEYVMLGFNSEAEAEQAYMDSHQRGNDIEDTISMTMAEYKEWRLGINPQEETKPTPKTKTSKNSTKKPTKVSPTHFEEDLSGDDDFDLTAQTEEELAELEEQRIEKEREEARIKAAEEAKTKKTKEEADDKQQAEATVDDFELGQTAEEQLTGGDLFSGNDNTSQNNTGNKSADIQISQASIDTYNNWIRSLGATETVSGWKLFDEGYRTTLMRKTKRANEAGGGYIGAEMVTGFASAKDAREWAKNNKTKNNQPPTQPTSDNLDTKQSESLEDQVNNLDMDEISTMFDDVATDNNAVETSKPKTKRSTKGKTPEGKPRPKPKVAPAEKKNTGKAQGNKRASAEIAKSMGVNLNDAGMNALDGLAKLFGGNGTLNSGLSFNEETYAKARPHFVQAAKSAMAAGKDLKALMKSVVGYFGDGIKPYFMRFVEEIKDGTVKLSDEGTLGREAIKNNVLENIAKDDWRNDLLKKREVLDGLYKQGYPLDEVERELNIPEGKLLTKENIDEAIGHIFDNEQAGTTTTRGEDDVSSTDRPMEPSGENQGGREPSEELEAVVEGDTRNPARPDGETPLLDPREDGAEQPTTEGIFDSSSVASDERGNIRNDSQDGQSATEGSSTRGNNDQRSDNASNDGTPVESVSTEAVKASSTENLKTKKARQEQAESVPVKRGNLENIRETLPYLLPAQQEDVHKTESRFEKENGYGMLLTNGTGTGKTFSALGTVKRYSKEGKNNVLIIVPDHKVAKDWVDSGKALGLDITQLKDTADGGKGITVTLYANAGANTALAQRNWDLVVADEAHNLMAGSQAKPTKALGLVRAITYHTESTIERRDRLYPEEANRAIELKKEIDWIADRIKYDGLAENRITEFEKEKSALENERFSLLEFLRKKTPEVEAEIESNQGVKRPRLLALTATPFSYVQTIDWANEYLFDYSEGKPKDGSQGYNEGNNRDNFIMANFGYRMRYNKLTKPDANVDVGLMERQFNERLRKNGSISGRSIDVAYDYDRRFKLIESGIGKRIDEALEFLQERSRGGDNGFHGLSEKINKTFSYIRRRYLLESIKAEAAISEVKRHLELDRKVVVFHDYKKGGSINPFLEARSLISEVDENKAFEIFADHFPDLVNPRAFMLPRVIDQLKKEIPDTLLANGDERKQDVLDRYKKFQSDESGPQVLLVQSAKSAGWSGHDTTGKHQRVIINLGLPTTPASAIQQEGRIYRVGQASNAIIRYMNTGTNWERTAFAETIAGRSGTVENMAMGNQARALKQSFIDAFEEADTYEPGHVGEGEGGKGQDKARESIITPYDEAKTYYYGQGKKTSKTKSAEGADYFATPEPVGLKMAEWIDVNPGESALEPSAGHGAIARWLPESARRTFVEPSNLLRSKLSLITGENDKVISNNFEDFNIVNKFDGIAMNPPFGRGGKLAAEHVEKAIGHLREGGRVAALIPEGPAADKRFSKLLSDEKHSNIYEVASIHLPSVTFERAGTKVRAKIIVLEKRTSEEATDLLPNHRRLDFTSHDKIGDLFDALEDVNLDPRKKEDSGSNTGGNQPLVGSPIRGSQNTEGKQGEATNNESFDTWNGEHTKTGETLYLTKPTEKLEKDTYFELRRMAKAHGGFWDRFSKGFRFDSNEDRQAFLNDFNDAPLFSRINNSISQTDVSRLQDKIEQDYGLNSLFLSLNEKKGTLSIDNLVVPRSGRSKGTGSMVMNEVISFADSHGLMVTLSPGLQDSLQGTTSRRRLVEFYKRFGFVENTGRSKDFSISAGMYRAPVGNEMLSRGSSNSNGMTKAHAQEIADNLLGGNATQQNVHVVQSYAELPADVKRAIGMDGTGEGDFNALHYKGSSYIVADAMRSQAEVEAAVFHEHFTHGGLRKLYGKELAGKLDDMLFKSGGLVGVRMQAKKQGIDLSAYENALSNNPNISNENKKRILMEELLAHMAHTTGTLRRRLEEVLGAIRQWLRDNGFGELANLRASDIAYTLRQTREAATPQQTRPKTVPAYARKDNKLKYLRAFHGSPHLFNEFELESLGSGTGAQAYGHGLYFAGHEDVARYYKEMAEHGEGNLYQVDIPELSDLLDHGLALDKQPKKVQTSIKKLMAKPEAMLFAETEQAVKNNATGEEIYNALSADLNSQQMASEVLNDAGIPGLTYQGIEHRAVGGTDSTNYVIWDDNLVTIEAINGQQAQAQSMIGVQAIRGRYNKNQLDLFEELDSLEKVDPYENTTQRPNTTEKQRQLGRSALSDLFRWLRDSSRTRSDNAKSTEGGVSLIGASIYKNFKAGKPYQLTGKTVNSTADLAALAQVYRDPRFETFRAFYLDKNNKIILEEAASTRMPSSVRFAKGTLEGIKEKQEEIGASKVYILHNHPSGNPEPSRPDVDLTNQLNNILGFAFAGHVVIDHNKYAFINKQGDYTVHEAEELAGIDFSTRPEVPHELLEKEIQGLSDLAVIGKKLAHSNDPVIVVTKGGVASKTGLIASLPMEFIERLRSKNLSKKTQATAVVRRMIRAGGVGGKLFVVLPKNAKLSVDYQWMHDFAQDVVDSNGNSVIKVRSGDVSIDDFAGVSIRGNELSGKKTSLREKGGGTYGRQAGAIKNKAELSERIFNDEERKKWRSKNKVNQRQERIPSVQVAAQRLQSGELTQEEYIEIVRRDMPIHALGEVPRMPTLLDVGYAIDEKKAATGIVGVNKTIQSGKRVGLRLDIPAYDNYDTWVVSIHDGATKGGKALGYAQTGYVSNVEFMTAPKGALNIATGKMSKATIARIHGDWVNHNPEGLARKAEQAISSREWIEVGMNPFRHSWFYDKSDGQPVVSADEVIQIGALVLARNAKKTSVHDPQFTAGKDSDIRFSRKPQTETAAFKKWFGNSKVTDAKGDPLVAHHGSGSRFTVFDSSKLGDNTGASSAQGGFFFTDSKVLAQGFMREAQSKNVDFSLVQRKLESLTDKELEDIADKVRMDDDLEIEGREYFISEVIEKLEQDTLSHPDDRSNIERDLRRAIGGEVFDVGSVRDVYLSIKNPLEVNFYDDNEYMDGALTNAISNAKSEGKDGVIFRNMSDAATLDEKGNGAIRSNVYVVFEPAQIKSATDNNGGFDPSNPDIRFSRKGVGQTGTEAFKAWFGDKGIRDDRGEPKIFYHNGNASFSQINKSGDFGGIFVLPDEAVDYGGKDFQLYLKGPIASTSDLMAYLDGLPDGGKSIIDDHFYEDISKDDLDVIIEAVLNEGWTGDGFLEAAQVSEDYAYAEMQKIRGVIAKNAGFTSVEIVDEFNGSTILVVDPFAIKSATENSGAFDPTNPDIRFSRNQSAFSGDASGNAVWESPSASKFDNFVYRMQDKQIDIKRVIGAIKDTGKAIADDLDVYLQETLFHGRAAKRTQDFVNHELTPLTEYMRSAKMEMSDLEEYLHARHAPEANAVIADRNPEIPDGGSGMMTAEAEQYMDSLNGVRKRQLEHAAKLVDDIIKDTRSLIVSYGLERQETVDGWTENFKHYIPLQREDKDGAMGIGQGFSVKGREVKGRTGSTRKVVDILANVMMQRERIIVRGEKNRVANALLGLAKENPLPDFWEVDKVPTQQVLDSRTGKVRTQVDPLYKMRPNVMVTKVNGEEHSIVFNEDDPRAVRMAESLKNLDADQLEGLIGATATATRYFASINTQYNPIFGVTNMVRDIQEAMLNMTSTEINSKQSDVFKNTFPSIKEIFKAERIARKGGTNNSKEAQLWQEFQEVGGQTGYRDQFRTGADRAKSIEKTLTPEGWAKTGLGKFFTADGRLTAPLELVRSKMGWLLDLLSDYNIAMENGVRLSAYKAGLETGMSKQKAAALAKSLTVNFNRKGQVTQQAGALYAFFNASVQGSTRMAETIFEMEAGKPKTIRLSKMGKRVFAGAVTMGSMQTLMLAAAGFGDDEPPEFIRERNIIIPTGGKTYVTIPLPLGFHTIFNLGRVPTEFAMGGGKDKAKHLVSLLDVMSDVYNPLGGAGLSVQTIAPTVADPLVALAENKDFAGRSIAKESFNRQAPGHALARNTASLPATWLAQSINYLTGGTEFTRGELSPTPDQIDYLVGQVTGGVGRELTKFMQTGQAIGTGDDLPWHKIPLAGRFFGNADSDSGKQSAFYNNLDNVRKHYEEVKGLRNNGRYQEAKEYSQKHPHVRLRMSANRTETQVRKLRQRKYDLEAQGASIEKTQAVQKRMIEIMERFNKTAKEL